MISISETKNDRELVRASVVAQIRTFHQQLADLKSELNKTLPISFLPNELLARILLEVAYSTGHIITITCNRAWMPILYVCRRWTACALALPALWSHIAVRSSEWFTHPPALMDLARAGNYPLTCDMILLDTASVALARAFLCDRGARVRTLRLWSMLAAVEDLFAGVQDLPILEELVLDKATYSGTALFPEHLLRAAPRLSSVSLHGMRIHSWGLLANLTELSVGMRGMSPVPGVPLAELLGSLAQSPGLRALTLNSVLAQDADTLATLLQHRPLIPSTELPALERLDIFESCHGIGALLSSLAIPPTAKLLLMPLFVHSERELKFFTHPLRRILHRAERPLMRALAVEVKYTFLVTLVLRRTRDVHVPDSGQVEVRMILREGLGRRMLRTTALRMLDAFPLEGVVDVDCAGLPRTLYSRATWRAIFSRLPRAARLHGGAEDAMLNMVGGLLDVLRSGPQASKSTLKQRNRVLQHTEDCPSSVYLSVLRSTGPVRYGDPYRISARLEELLALYRDAHAGQVWDELELVGRGVPFRTGLLGPLAKRLLIGTTVWTPDYEGQMVMGLAGDVEEIGMLAVHAAPLPTTVMVSDVPMHE
ncbi:hypothetical protein FA95DRAFT_1681672 [Auriscalpium vulgare]|uniref:Uncharacterized protein n=1 Tax=Auriscalpium vulgare TaxID=40419 RepID=A0ACB8RJH8_9AGAM|nr:hypothetical protein FA95DRAFT_1681672 [Auriscalpium vulgare]